MKNVTIYHNPRCSKSRQALQILQLQSTHLTVIEYLKNPLSHNEITDLLKKLGKKPREIMRKKELVYQELNIDNENLTDSDLILAIVNNPILLERPIVVKGAKALIARPPEKVLELIK